MEDALPIVQKAYNMKKSNNFAQQFESWADNVSEGTWAKPEGEEQVAELIDLLMEPLTVGIDGIDAQNKLYPIIGDDQLFDKLYDLSNENPEADARDVVMDWIQENMPKIYGQVMAAIGDEDTERDYEPELDEGTLDSGDFDSDAFYDGDLSDQQFLAKHGFTKQELYDHPVFAANNEYEREQDRQDRYEFSPEGRLEYAIKTFKPGPYSVYSPERAKHLAQNWWQSNSEDYPNLTKEQFFAQIGITDAIAENYDDEENDSSDAVQAAIIRRIINSHSDLLSQYGPEAITNASRDVAEWVGKVEEIGSSDVSAWVKEVINNLGDNDQDIDSPDQFNRGGELDEATGALDAIIANNKEAVDYFIKHNELGYDLESDLHEYYYDRLSGSAQRDSDDIGEVAELFTNDLTDMGLMGNVDEGIVDTIRGHNYKRLAARSADKAKALKSRSWPTPKEAAAHQNDWYDRIDAETQSMDRTSRAKSLGVDEAIGDDAMTPRQKNIKMKRMGAGELSTLDKARIMPRQMKAMAKGDDESDLTAYNKQFNEEIAQMRKIAGLGK
jgi:hypothetical protein